MPCMKEAVGHADKREIGMYILTGGLTTAENIMLFWLLHSLFGVEYMLANFVTLIAVKLTAYVLSKLYVFKSRTDGIRELLAEFWRFVLARGATFLVDYFGLIFCVSFLGLNAFASKCGLTLLVIVLNYIFSKKMVFREK